MNALWLSAKRLGKNAPIPKTFIPREVDHGQITMRIQQKIELIHYIINAFRSIKQASLPHHGLVFKLKKASLFLRIVRFNKGQSSTKTDFESFDSIFTHPIFAKLKVFNGGLVAQHFAKIFAFFVAQIIFTQVEMF